MQDNQTSSSRSQLYVSFKTESWDDLYLAKVCVRDIDTWMLYNGLKTMLHEAIFLATCNGTMTNKKPCKLQRGCYTQATCIATLRKVGSFYFSCNSQRNNCSCKNGVLHMNFFLATCNATFVALQVVRKIASCNMTFTDCTRLMGTFAATLYCSFNFLVLVESTFTWFPLTLGKRKFLLSRLIHIMCSNFIMGAGCQTEKPLRITMA